QGMSPEWQNISLRNVTVGQGAGALGLLDVMVQPTAPLLIDNYFAFTGGLLVPAPSNIRVLARESLAYTFPATGSGAQAIDPITANEWYTYGTLLVSDSTTSPTTGAFSLALPMIPQLGGRSWVVNNTSSSPVTLAPTGFVSGVKVTAEGSGYTS